MKTTLTIILTILFLTFFSPTAVAEKTGYCKTFSIRSTDEPNNLTLFSVPLDTKFVLERLYISGRGDWSLNVNSTFSMSGSLTTNIYMPFCFTPYEFPTGTVVFNAEDDIVLSFPCISSSTFNFFFTIIGYFEDTAPAKSSADINGDGKVDMLDFAILSKQWLNNA